MKYLLILLVFCCACNNKQEQTATKVSVVKPLHFKSFEISRGDFWTGEEELSFYTDSTGIYFAPELLASIYYGILPDSLRCYIDSVVSMMAKDTSIKNNKENCADCDEVSVIAVNGLNDTLRVVQYSKINPLFVNACKKLKSFLTKNKQEHFNGYIYLKTQEDVSPPPPPPLKRLSRHTLTEPDVRYEAPHNYEDYKIVPPQQDVELAR